MNPIINEITANTSKMWINPPAFHTNAPNNHPIISITAIKYNIDLIAQGFVLYRWIKDCATHRKTNRNQMQKLR
jgi:hypothetical protein